MLSSQQVSTMLSLQAGMNSKVDPDWVQARYPYHRAVVIEASEAIEHHGWKWWKMQELDLPQLQMELIDVWHFLLSELLLQEEADIPATARKLESELKQLSVEGLLVLDGQSYRLSELDLLRKLELLIAASVCRRVELALFSSIMTDCQLSWQDLFRQYVGKNVLNFFRQDNGYKEGSYRKIWGGREDNEYLVDVISLLDPAASDYQSRIYSELEAHYERNT